ncbi:MAG: hypothetical protein M3294_06345 [Pseudomonadota bacterium]|nr:hypothetical protein [Pseudomonadota bacterium]
MAVIQHQKKPAILGALLDLVSRALRQLPNTHLDTLPRMADFAKWATAAEPIEEKGTFIRAYQDNRQSAIEASLEGSPVATVLREMVKEVLHWEGTATELLNLLWQRADERTKMQRSWPKSAKGLSGQLRRLATALRATGIEIKHKRAGKGGTRIIHIKTVCKDSSEPSAASASEQEQTLTADEWLTHMKNRRWDVEHANMSAVKHIQDTHRQGGSVKVDVDDLNLTAPQPLPADLLNQIRQHKAELLAYLSADAANTIDPMGHVLTVDQANGGNYLEKLGTVAPASLMCHLEPRR